MLDATPEALERECCVCQPATLIRAEAFERIGGIDERYDMAFDYDLWFRLMRDAPAPVRSAKRWARARMHPASKTARGPKTMYTEVVRLLRRHRGYVPFSWAHAYADFVIRRRDQFFDPPRGSPLRTMLTLVLGLAHNPGHPLRFTQEFVKETVRLRKNRSEHMTAHEPLVTIVTPSFNQGRFIRETIESVLTQDYPHVEYIIMDGASTDETADVVRPYLDRVRFISEPDRGQSHAINKGFALARGEIVAWLNSDDLFLPGAIRHAVDAFQAIRTPLLSMGKVIRLTSSAALSRAFRTPSITICGS